MPEIALNPPPFNPHGEKGESGVLMAETGDGTQGCAKTSTPVRVRGQRSEVKLRTENQEPRTRNRELRTRNQEPGTRNQKLRTGFNLQPSTFNPQPSTLNPQPSTLNLQPSTFNLQQHTPRTRLLRSVWRAGRGMRAHPGKRAHRHAPATQRNESGADPGSARNDRHSP